MELSKVSIPSQKPAPVVGSTRQYPLQYLDIVKQVTKWEVCEILNALETFYSICFSCTSKIVSMSHYPYITERLWKEVWSLIVTFPCELLCSSKNFYTVLTHWIVYIEIAGNVPVWCIAVGFIVTLFTVEHKKLRIWHKLLY